MNDQSWYKKSIQQIFRDGWIRCCRTPTEIVHCSSPVHTALCTVHSNAQGTKARVSP
jgi:hypothetical protein